MAYDLEWCEHIVAVKEPVHDDMPGYYLKGWSRTMDGVGWKFCPICGKRRPVTGDVRCITTFLKSIDDVHELIIDWNKRTVTLNSRSESTRVDKHKKSINRSLYMFEKTVKNIDWFIITYLVFVFITMVVICVVALQIIYGWA